MSGDNRIAEGPLKLALLGLVTCGGWAPAAEQPLPAPEFLEYLGSFEESDEDWLLFEDTVSDPAVNIDEELSDPVPEGEESPESNDEY